MTIYQDQSSGFTPEVVQVVNSATSTTVNGWGYTVQATLTTTGQTLTLPAIALTDITKSITIQNAGTFAFTLAIASGTITSAIGLIINPGSTFVVKAVSTTSAIVVSPTVAQNVPAENGTTVNTTGNTSYPANSALITFTLPSVGRFDVDTQIGANFSAVGNGNLYIRTSAGVEVPNSRVYVQNGSQGAMAAPIHINTQIDNLVANTTYQLWTAVAWAAVYGYDTPTPSQGGTKVTWNKISGFSPSTGQTVDYLKVKRTSTSQVLALNTDILFNSSQTGNIPYNPATGLATLSAGKLYRIKSRLVARNDGTGTTGRYILYDILTSANTALPSAANSTTGVQFLATSANNEGGGSEATADFLPTVNTDIKIRISGVDGNNFTLDADRSYLEITQLGSSPTIATPLPKVTNFTASGTFTRDPLSTYAIVEMVGSGGQGGYGFGTAGANTAYVGMGGGSGAYVKVLLTAAQLGTSQPVTIGAAGSSTSLGTLASAGGGNPGTGIYVNSDSSLISGTATPTQPRATFTINTGTDLGSKFGNLPSNAFVSQTSGRCCVQTSDGADSEMGRGARGLKPPSSPQSLTTPGGFAAQAAGANTGGGGSGDATYSPTAANGIAGSVAAGGSGFVKITEWFN
jgi:hypothetical protein